MLNQLICMILFASIKNIESKSLFLVETDHKKTYLVEKAGTSIMAANDVKPKRVSTIRRTGHAFKENLFPLRRNTEICSIEEFRSNGQDGDPCRTHMDCSYLQGQYVCQLKTGTKEGKCKKSSCSSNEDCHLFTDLPSKCYKRSCVPKFCYSNKDCPTGYGCHDMVCKQIFGQDCERDCDCGLCNDKVCFKRHCYCKDEFQCTSTQEVGLITAANPELITPDIVQSRDDTCTTSERDCIGPNKLCNGKQERNCICKNNKCKLSSYCGMQKLGFYIDCSSCSTEDCEDEGSCIIEHGNCVPVNTGGTYTEINANAEKTENASVPIAIERTGFTEHLNEIEFITPGIVQSRDDTCTTAETDCIGPDKLCIRKQEGDCICKNNKCKLSSGCGMQILGSYIDCSSCSTEDCEDEGSCIIEDGNCVSVNVENGYRVINANIENAENSNVLITTEPTSIIEHPNEIELITPGIAQGRDDLCTTVETDCVGPDKLCDRIQEGNCICKNNKCKISSGCGTQILGSYIDCSSCSTEDCDDEDACIIEDGNCVPKNTEKTNTGNANTGNTKVLTATEPTELEEGATMASPIATEMPELIMPAITQSRDDSCTTAETDCIGTEKLCDGQQDGNCICKNNKCKISSGCGIQIMGSFKDCSICSIEDCDDEGACIIEDGHCIMGGEIANRENINVSMATEPTGVATQPDEMDISTEDSATIHFPINQTTMKATTNIVAPKKSESEEESTMSSPITTEMPDISTEDSATIHFPINQTTMKTTTNIVAPKKSESEEESTMSSPIATEMPGNECVTNGGEQTGKSCVFPFIFEGIKYEGCTDTSNPWCATTVDGNGGYITDKWGYCVTGCKVHGGGIFRPMWTSKPMHKLVENTTRRHKKITGM